MYMSRAEEQSYGREILQSAFGVTFLLSSTIRDVLLGAGTGGGNDWTNLEPYYPPEASGKDVPHHLTKHGYVLTVWEYDLEEVEFRYIFPKDEIREFFKNSNSKRIQVG